MLSNGRCNINKYLHTKRYCQSYPIKWLMSVKLIITQENSIVKSGSIFKTKIF